MKQARQHAIVLFSWVSALLLVTGVAILLGYLLVKGWSALGPSLVFGNTPPLEALLLRRQVFDGLLPAIIGTLLLVVLAVGTAIPIGVAGGIYMAEYGRGPVKKILDFFFDLLAAIPSIVIGLLGFSVAILLHRFFSDFFPCLFIASLSLAFLILPYIIRTTQIALESVPLDLRRTAPSLGATRLQNIVYVLLPQALPSMISGIILAVGRCAEDRAVIMLTGAVASAGLPRSIFDNFEALPFYIYYISAQYSDPGELSKGYGAAIILLCLCLILFGVAFWIKARFNPAGR